jgi:hypothetical protein
LPQDKQEVRSRIQDFMHKLLHLPERVRSLWCARTASFSLAA